ncbi:MAG: DUF1036 domain-containing protein [Pseudomonadota bacterium]
MRFPSLTLSIILYALATHSAQAELKVCNESGAKRSVAIAYKKDGAWQSEGWWNIDNGLCKTVVSGDLKQRYYYFRATSDGRNIGEGKYSFCTDPKVFTIVGEKDCQYRGYEKSNFDVIDTGKSAASFTFTIAASNTSASKPSQPQKKTNIAPGTHGEPFTRFGVFQGCDIFDGASYCAFHAEGWKHFAWKDGGTPDAVLDELESYKLGTALTFEGDTKSFGDITSDVVIRDFRAASNDPHQSVRQMMQGKWRSTSDSSNVFEIAGSEQTEIYGGEVLGANYLRWRDQCDGSNGAGPVILATNPEDRQEPICHFIVSVTANKLVLSYIGGTGQDKEFVRVR